MQSTSEKILLTVKDLTVGYDNGPVLEGLNFSLEEKNFLSIIGANGTGKSTLLKTILGIIKPINGKVVFPQGRKSIGYIPQLMRFRNDFPAIVSEVVNSGFTSGVPKVLNTNQLAIAEHYMKMFKVDKYAKSSIYELSGGEQQRVLLARALCSGSRILFLDEPISSLDEKSQGEIYLILKALNERINLTVIMSTHDIDRSLSYSSHVLVLSHGHQNFFGSIKSYKNEEAKR